MEAWARWRRASEYEDLLAEERVLGDKRRAGPDGVDADRAHQRCPSADGPQHVLDGPATFVDASTDGRLDGPGQPVQHAGLLSHRVLGSRGRGTRFSQQRLTALRRKPLLCGWTGQVASTGGNVGGKFTVGDVTVTLVPALHSSDPGGRPLGFILKAPGAPSIYHSSDTWIFSDMALIQELFSPSVLLLQAGGGAFNMDPTTAALAVTKYFTTAGAIIPMHFGTFTGLATEAQVRAAFASDARLTVMTPGQTVTF